MRPMRAREVFADPRFQERAQHLARMADVVFGTTDVSTFISQVNRDRLSAGQNQYPIIEGRLGDPTAFEGIRSYPGIHRHDRRYTAFHKASSYDGYDLGGDPRLKERLLQGKRSDPRHITVTGTDVEIYMTPGVAGALRLICDALILPPKIELPDLSPILLGSLRSGAESDRIPDSAMQEARNVLTLIGGMHSLDNIIIPRFTYPSHLAEIYRAHGRVKICPTTNDGQVDLNALEAIIDSNTRAILFATVGNPLSVAIKSSIFNDILDLVALKMKKYGQPILVIADTIYESFRRDTSERLDPIQLGLYRLVNGLETPPLIAMSSFSKMMAIPGQRVGYFRVLWPKDTEYPQARQSFLRALDLLYGPTLCPVSRQIQRALGALHDDINSGAPIEEELAPFVAVLQALKNPPTDYLLECTAHPFFTRDEINARISTLDIPEGYFTAPQIASMVRGIANAVLSRGYGVDLTTSLVTNICNRLEETNVDNLPLVVTTVVQNTKFYKLNPVVYVPELRLDEDGQLPLYGISRDVYWRKIAEACGIDTETDSYLKYKLEFRKTVFDRVWYFAQLLDSFRGAGVYMHPAYYDESGHLVQDRFNAFYVLWGLEGLRASYTPEYSQASRFARLCVAHDVPIIAQVPGELFVPSDDRSAGTSYMRNVALQPPHTMDMMYGCISSVATEVAQVRKLPSK